MSLVHTLELSFSSVSQKKYSTDQQSTDMQRHMCNSRIPNLNRSITKGFTLLSSGYGRSVCFSTFYFPWDHILKKKKKKSILPFDKVFCIIPGNSSRQMYLSHRMKGIFGGVCLTWNMMPRWWQNVKSSGTHTIKSVGLEQVSWISAG